MCCRMFFSSVMQLLCLCECPDCKLYDVLQSESYKNGKVPFSKTKCPASRKFQFAVQTQSVGECKKTSKVVI